MQTLPIGTPSGVPQSQAPSRFLLCRAGVPRPHFSPSFFLPAFLAMLPALFWARFGYGGQDFSFHIASWLELHAAWQAHEWRLGWASAAQYGYGEPRFCFYPPVSLLIGGLLSFVVPLRLLPGVVAWAALFAAGASMWVAWGRLVGERHRLLASLAYVWNWYLLFCVVVRYAIAEAWVLALLPLIFLFFYLLVVDARIEAAPALALLLALAWLTNIPSSIVLFYSLGFAAAVLALQRRSPGPFVLFALAEAGSLGVAAFRVLPALTESTLVQAHQMLRTLDFRGSLIGRHMAAPHSLQFYIVGSPMLLSCLLLPAAWKLRAGRPGVQLAPFVAFIGLMLFIAEPLSIPLWRLLPHLSYVGFAFRFEGLFSLAAVFLLFAAWQLKTLRMCIAVLMVFLSLAPFFLFFHSLFSFQRFADLPAAAQQWAHGYEGVPEYVPSPVPPSVSKPDAERSGAFRPVFTSLNCSPALLGKTPNTATVAVASERGCLLQSNVFAYPFWQAKLEHGPSLALVPRADGLLATQVPAGRQTVVLEFEPRSALRTWSAVVSALVSAVLLALACSAKLRSRLGLERWEGRGRVLPREESEHMI